MLHNQRRKSKGENFFILLFLLQEMMHLCYPCLTALQNTRHGSSAQILVGLLADERGHVEIINARIRHHRPRQIVSRTRNVARLLRGHHGRRRGSRK